MALDALSDFAAVCSRHPEARSEVQAALGEELLREVDEAREVIARAAARIEGTQQGSQ